MPLGSTSRWAPTRTTSSFAPPDPSRYLRTSNSAGVKQGRCSPTSWPFTRTRVPNIALWIFSLATSGIGPSTENVRRYQKACRCWPLWAVPTSAYSAQSPACGGGSPQGQALGGRDDVRSGGHQRRRSLPHLVSHQLQRTALLHGLCGKQIG